MISHRPDLNAAISELNVSKVDEPYFKQAYTSSEMYMRSWMAYFSGKQQESQNLLSMAYATNPDDQWIGFGLADAMFGSKSQAVAQGYSEIEILTKVLDIRPDHLEALRSLKNINVENGNLEEVERLKKLMKLIAPLDKEIISGK